MRLIIDIPDVDHAKLKARAAALGIPLTRLIRKACEPYLSEESAPLLEAQAALSKLQEGHFHTVAEAKEIQRLKARIADLQNPIAEVKTPKTRK